MESHCVASEEELLKGKAFSDWLVALLSSRKGETRSIYQETFQQLLHRGLFQSGPPFLQIFLHQVIFKMVAGFFIQRVASKFHRDQEIILPNFCLNSVGEQESNFLKLDVKRS